jgi:hypothetical protein
MDRRSELDSPNSTRRFRIPSTLHADSIRVRSRRHPMLTVFGHFNDSPSRFDQRGGTFSSRVLSATNSVSASIQTVTAAITQLDLAADQQRSAA